MANVTKNPEQKKEKFLHALATGGNVFDFFKIFFIQTKSELSFIWLRFICFVEFTLISPPELNYIVNSL